MRGITCAAAVAKGKQLPVLLSARFYQTGNGGDLIERNRVVGGLLPGEVVREVRHGFYNSAKAPMGTAS